VELASSTGRKLPAETEGVDVIMEISSAPAIASSSSAGAAAAAVSASLLAYRLEVLMGRKQICRLQRSGPRLEMGEGDSGRKPVEQKTCNLERSLDRRSLRHVQNSVKPQFMVQKVTARPSNKQAGTKTQRFKSSSKTPAHLSLGAGTLRCHPLRS